MFAIGVLPKCGNMWSYLVHQNFSLLRLSNIDHFLDNIVSKLVLHHGVKCTVMAEIEKKNNHYNTAK